MAGADAEPGRSAPAEPALIAGYSVPDLKGFLRGRWCLARLFIDRRGQSGGTLTGFADFADHGADLLYEERGALAFAGFHATATRRYCYAFPEPHRCRVRFTDGRVFHDLDLSRGRWSIRHTCGSDCYHGRFTVRTEREWRVIWTVAGPKKDLTIESTYIRCI
jgi:hypothetical protein